MTDITAPVTKIQKFCTHDGPGIRTTVFLKGCPLRCEWCHNPETQSSMKEYFYNTQFCIGCGNCASVCPAGVHKFDNEKGHIVDRTDCIRCMKCVDVCPTGALESCAKEMHAADVFNIVLQDKAFYEDNGGLTISGGEPMVHPEFTIELLLRSKAAGITTAIETCGYFGEKWIKTIAPLTDTFLWDFKDGNIERHKKYTGVSNERIIRNLHLVDEYDTNIRLRCIMVKSVNMDEANLSAIADCYKSLSHCEGVELLPYHVYGSSKRVQIGGDDNGNTEWVPNKTDLNKAKRYLKCKGVRVI